MCGLTGLPQFCQDVQDRLIFACADSQFLQGYSGR